ncbi:hypothetical protein C2G38_2160888 [Gigaspora rosea]|uniref:Uncharacterized protein n=1 Tax=Gigaspora rosea TaxID=44941 RepID=A0A397W4T8_9GLOM|nr:hypothetical protein C2G38_2160888 [Gigaspora rosea]
MDETNDVIEIQLSYVSIEVFNLLSNKLKAIITIILLLIFIDFTYNTISNFG